MSLLLDARTKAQGLQDDRNGQAAPGSGQHNLARQPVASGTDAERAEVARSIGRNLFGAKLAGSSPTYAGINRNLLILLGATVILFVAGAGYVWHLSTAGDAQPLHPASRAMPAPQVAQPVPASVPAAAKEQPAPDAQPDSTSLAASGKPASRTEQAQRTEPIERSGQVPDTKPTPRAQPAKPVVVRQQPTGSIDALLHEAYQDYRNANFAHARQLYRAALVEDARNSDALLGLAVIAQHQGENDEAAHFYARVLTLDPRNAVANAGMSALTTDENRESRLKTLLYEQPDAPSLYFALGNHYAAQSRWSDAQQAYFSASKYDPDNAVLSFNLAISLDRLGQKKLAAQHYRRALQLDTHNSAGFDHSAISLRAQELSR